MTEEELIPQVLRLVPELAGLREGTGNQEGRC